MPSHRTAGRTTLARRLALGLMLVPPLAGCTAGGASQQRADSTTGAPSVTGTMVTLDAEALTWRTLQPEGFPPGMQIAVLQGDRTKPELFTVRLHFPDGFRFPAHRHPSAEHLTVISGALVFGAGERFDERRLRTYQAGDFLVAPAGMAHFGGAAGETVVQLHGMGPFGITVVDPYIPSPAR